MSYSYQLNTSIQVFLVDHHKAMLWGVERLINEQTPRMQVIGKATHQVELFSALESLSVKAQHPDVILMDIQLNGVISLDLLETLINTTTARILIFTGVQDPIIHQQAILNGASGIVLKSEEVQVLLRAIESVYHGEIWFDRTSTSRLLKSLSSSNNYHTDQYNKISSLTAKERAIVIAMAETPSSKNKIVAGQLCISEHTLRNHLTNIYSKLELSNRVELYMYAMKNKLVSYKSAA